MQKKLTQLVAKATEKGHWALAAAATRALNNDTVDDHINVLGAMHEVGLLKNSWAPFSKVWRAADTAPFIAACIRRLGVGDADYWALAALLEMNIAAVAPALLDAGFALLTINHVPAFKDPELHVATLARRNAATPETLAPLIVLGWNAKTGELYDVSRWRAVILETMQGSAPQLSGQGFGSYFMRAKLPYGCWRILHDNFKLEDKSAIPEKQTLWPQG